MNRSYRITPVYTGDVSGVCSALYELGGMTVIHDPSGCNSTYNTHDETRWYQQDSLIFLSGLKHRDAVMGNDDRLIDGVVQAAQELQPKFITLCSSPIPYINGTDFSAIARLIERKTSIPVINVPTNGMHDYTLGAGAALAALARRFVTEKQSVIPRSLNILGMTPLDFAAKGSLYALTNIIEQQGWQIISSWAMGSTLEQCQQEGNASMNLVVSSVGLETAKYLEHKFGTPYVVGCPIGNFAQKVFDCLEAGKTRVAYLDEGLEDASGPEITEELVLAECGCKNRIQDNKREQFGNSANTASLTLIGEPVTMGSLAAAIELQAGFTTQVICPLEAHKGLLRPQDISAHGEEEVEGLLQRAKIVVADPLYRPLCQPEVIFYSLPHQAFSGRCFRKEERNLFELEDMLKDISEGNTCDIF